MSNKIRILYTIPNFDTAGSGIPLLKIANNLDKNYFEPHIACLHERGKLFQDVRDSGIKVHIIDLYKNARPIISMLRECYQLSKVFKKINPDIIHSYHYASDYTEPLAAKMASVKWIYTKKNMSWKGPSYRSWKLRSWLADGIICQNTNMLRSFFPNWRKAKLIPIGVDIHEFKKQPDNNNIKKRLGIPGNDRIIISIANLVPIKGIEVLIQAFKLLTANYPDWKLMIVGDDTTEYGVELKNLSENLNMKDRVIFTGRQNSVREFLDISEIYVQPSLTPGEGSPIGILEAMANEKNIIASNVPGIRDQMAAFPDHLLKAGSIVELSEKLKFFMSKSKYENNKLGKSFYEYGVKNYDISIEKIEIENFYESIINDKVIS